MAVNQLRGDMDQEGNSASDEKSQDYIQNVELKVFADEQNVESEREESRMKPKEFGRIELPFTKKGRTVSGAGFEGRSGAQC